MLLQSILLILNILYGIHAREIGAHKLSNLNWFAAGMLSGSLLKKIIELCC